MWACRSCWAVPVPGGRGGKEREPQEERSGRGERIRWRRRARSKVTPEGRTVSNGYPVEHQGP